MDTDHEARFLTIDADAIRDTLSGVSAHCVMSRTLIRRVTFKNAEIEDRGGWLRLRDEGHRITLTYEQTTSGTSATDTILEAGILVNDFDAATALLKVMGMTALRYQENFREEWKLGDVTFDLDTWPGLPTFLEIEGPDGDAVRTAAAMLGLTHASYGSVDEVYLAVLNRDIRADETLRFS